LLNLTLFIHNISIKVSIVAHTSSRKGIGIEKSYSGAREKKIFSSFPSRAKECFFAKLCLQSKIELEAEAQPRHSPAKKAPLPPYSPTPLLR